VTRIVAFGAGWNSTAMLIGMADRGIHVDATLFSDTSAELPHTYRHVERMSDWCVKHALPQVTVVRVSGENIEQNLLRRKALPSVAYGPKFKTCSQRFKIEPQEKWCNNWPRAREAWDRGELIEKCVGFDLDEPQRAKPFRDAKYVNRYPLIEWEWGLEECREAIRRAGLPSPGKSSCFFCPNRTASEFRLMREVYPEYIERAMALEANANLTTIKGLKRDHSLKELLANSELFAFTSGENCGTCYDGGTEACDAFGS